MTATDRAAALALAREHLDDLHPQFENGDEAVLARALLAEAERCERLEAALRAIDSDPFISYDAHYREPGMSDANRQWQIGFTDGVRRCVDVVRPALKQESRPDAGEEGAERG